jgi:hypothetical protein
VAMCRSLDKVVAKFMSYLQASSLAKNNGNMRIQIFEFSELNSTGAKLGILTIEARDFGKEVLVDLTLEYTKNLD